MNYCPLCKQGTLSLLFHAGIYDITVCNYCRTAQTVTPKNIHRKQIYDMPDIQVYIDKQDMFKDLFRNLMLFIMKFINKGVFVDIGAGVGLLVNAAAEAGFDAIGFEPSGESVKIAKKIFHTKLIRGEFSLKKADVIVVNHVLEHVPDPRRLLSKIKKSLHPDGYLFVGVPNFGSFIAQAKKERWQSLIPDQHRWHFTLKTLDALVTAYGFRREGIVTDNHDRSIHPLWKRPFYYILDTITKISKNGEAIFVAYKKL